jgi:hypothetical protein
MLKVPSAGLAFVECSNSVPSIVAHSPELHNALFFRSHM